MTLRVKEKFGESGVGSLLPFSPHAGYVHTSKKPEMKDLVFVMLQDGQLHEQSYLTSVVATEMFNPVESNSQYSWIITHNHDRAS